MNDHQWTRGEVELLKDLCSKRMTWAERSQVFAENGYSRTKGALKCRAAVEGCSPQKPRPSRSREVPNETSYADWIIGYTDYVEELSEWR